MVNSSIAVFRPSLNPLYKPISSTVWPLPTHCQDLPFPHVPLKWVILSRPLPKYAPLQTNTISGCACPS